MAEEVAQTASITLWDHDKQKEASGSEDNVDLSELIEKKKRLEQELEQNELELKLHDSSKKTNERTQDEFENED